jgi:hypothetical protein
MQRIHLKGLSSLFFINIDYGVIGIYNEVYSTVKKFLCYLALFLFLSCSSEKPGDRDTQKTSGAESRTASEQSQPSVSPESGPYSLEITPVNASRKSTLKVIAQGFNLSDAKIEWLLNGQSIQNPTSSQFNARETRKGDNIQVKAIIDGKEIKSNIIEIKNAPPEIARVKILPEVFKPGDTLNVEVSASDIDGDEVTVSYEWTKNGEPAGNSKRLEIPLKRGDKIYVKITPFDGELYGPSVILHREIKNMPPKIIEDKKFQFDGKVYTYQIKAADPDGDPLTYSLKTAPAEMTIEPSTGFIHWNVPPEFKGKAPITVSVTDGHGGEAVQRFTFDIMPQK